MFPHYEFLFVELRTEVRGHCIPSARCMLALTCKAEHVIAVDRGILTHPHSLLFALAEDGENKLIYQTLSSPAFQEDPYKQWKSGMPYFHDLKHIAIRTCNSGLVQWLMHDDTYHRFDLQSCSDCLKLAMRTRNTTLIAIIPVPHLHTPVESYANILTVEAIRMNDVKLLEWLSRIGQLEEYPELLWDLPALEGGDSLSMALDWWDAFVYMFSRTGVLYTRFIYALCESMVARQWTFSQMKTFMTEHIQPKLGMDLDSSFMDIL